MQTGDGSSTLKDVRQDETYHSTFGALTESVEVFLRNSGVQQRFNSGEAARVLEIGFGTGLNFLITAKAAKESGCELAYTGIEYRLPPIELIHALWHDNLPDQKDLTKSTCTAIASSRARHPPQATTTDLPDSIDEFTTLLLLLVDAREVQFGRRQFDAIYLDAFSDRNNPQLWTTEFLQKLRSSLRNDGVLTTYSVSRKFRDSLSQAGFQWQKHRGPPGKREVLTATIHA